MGDDKDALMHLSERLQAATADRDREAADEASLILRKAAAAGRLASGNTVTELKRQAVDDVRIRGEFFFKALLDTWMSFRPSPSAIPQAQEMLTSTLQDAAATRELNIRSSAPAMSLSGLPETVWAALRTELQAPQHSLTLRLREWALLQQLPSTSPGSVQTTTVNLTGDHNTVVAGLMNSPANLQLDMTSTPRLLEALADVRLAVQAAASLPAQDRGDTLELIADAESELKRPQPNKRRLSSSLQGVASTIQTVGSLGEAYATLKGAMALIGIPLP